MPVRVIPQGCPLPPEMESLNTYQIALLPTVRPHAFGNEMEEGSLFDLPVRPDEFLGRGVGVDPVDRQVGWHPAQAFNQQLGVGHFIE